MASPKVLIADDSSTFRHLEEELLRRRGYELVHAVNGAQAIQLALKEAPQLILLDLQMPVMDGAKALSILKSNEKTSAIPVVMVTTVGDEAQRERLLKAGASAFLTKPIESQLLHDVVRKLIGTSA